MPEPVEGGRVIFRAEFDASELDESVKRAQGSLGRAGQAGQEALDQVERAAEDAARETGRVGEAAERSAVRFGRFVDAAGKLGIAVLGIRELGDVLGGVTEPVEAFLRSSIDAASDLGESLNKLRVVFGTQAQEVVGWLQDSAEAVGLSRQAAAEAVSTFGNLFVAMGLGQAEAANMSMNLVQLAADLASFNNVSVDEAFEKLFAGLRGEAEPLRAFGVLMSEAEVQAKALGLGLATTTKEITEQDKVLARYHLILEQTKNAQGDFGRTSEGLANTQRRLRAAVENLRASFGEQLLPLAERVANGLVGLVHAFDRLSPGTKAVVTSVGAAGAALGALIPILGAAGVAFSVMGGPVTALVFVIGALIATIVGLALNWDKLTQKFPALKRAADAVSGALRALLEIVRNLVPVVREALSALADLVGAQFDKLKTSLTTVARIVVAAFEGEWERIPEIAEEGTRAIEEADRRQREALERLANAHKLYGETQDRYAGRARTNISAYYAVTGALQDQEEQLVSILDVYTQFDAVLGESDKAIAHWQRNLRNAKDALSQLEEKRRKGIALSAEEQQEYEILSWYIRRLESGIEGFEAEQRKIIVAQAEYTRQLEDLDRALKSGQISQDEYNERVAQLNREFSDALGPVEQFKQAGEDITKGLDKVVDRLEDLLRWLGAIPPDVKINVEAETAIAHRNLLLVNQEIDGIPAETTTTVHAETEGARQELTDTKGLIEALPGERVIKVTADTWDAQSEIELIRNRTQNLTAVIRATIDTSQVYPEIDRLSRHLPHSPAEEGPLSREPNWQWLFAGLPAAAEQATDEALKRIREFAGGVRESWEAIGRAIDVVTRLSGLQARGGLPDLAVIDRLSDFATHLAARLGETAKQYETEVIEKTDRLARAIGAAFDAVGGAIEVAQRWRELEGEVPDFDALIDRLVPAAKRLAEALAVAADEIGAEGIAKAGVVAEGMRGIWDTLRGGIEVARGLSGETLAGLALLDTHRERIAEQLRRLVVTFTQSVAAAVSEAGAETLPERELVDRLLAPARSVLDALGAVGRAIEATEQVGAAIPRRVETLGLKLIEISRAFAQAVAQVGEVTLPEAEVTERLFAPARAVADLLGSLSRLIPSGEEGRPARLPDLGRVLQALVEGMRGAFGVIREVAGEPLPPVERLAQLSEVAGTIGRILEALTGSSEKLRGMSPRRFGRMAEDIAGAIREWIARLSEVSGELQPEMEQALDDLAALVAPIESIVEPVTGALTAAASWPRRWERALDTFIEAIRALIQGLADLRTELGSGVEDATAVAEAVAGIVERLSGVAGGSFQIAMPSVNLGGAAAVQMNSIAQSVNVSLMADLQVRLFVGERELRDVVADIVDQRIIQAMRTIR